jgi:hypothetical protein
MELFTTVTMVWCMILALNVGFGGYLIYKYQYGMTA